MDIFCSIGEKWLQQAGKLGVKAADIDEQFTRGSGKGGQKINKTSSTVILYHRPTGISVRCQKHRELSANRISALRLLIGKIDQLKRGKDSEKAKKIFKLKKQKQKRSKRAKEKMLKAKKIRGELKDSRKLIGGQ